MATQSLTALSTTDILDKDFRTELRGYSTNEVDDFLDEIIGDYVKLYKEIERLTAENEKLIGQLQSKSKTEDTQAPGLTSNYDILKRVSLLEKQVVEIMNHLKKRAEHEKMQRAAATAETVQPTTPTE